jgi:hypothetical protein
MMMEAVRSSETAANFYETIRRHIPEDDTVHSHHRENLISKIKIIQYLIILNKYSHSFTCQKTYKCYYILISQARYPELQPTQGVKTRIKPNLDLLAQYSVLGIAHENRKYTSAQ